VQQAGAGRIVSTQDLDVPSERAFALLCDIERWPVWMPFVRSARFAGASTSLGPGAELVVDAAILGDDDGLYEVEHFIAGHVLSLVGVYSVRRRIDFRIEGLGLHCRLVARLDYPAYGGIVGNLLDQITARPRLSRDLAAALLHFKGLAAGDDGGGLGLDDL
jgi:hypothetical protein